MSHLDEIPTPPDGERKVIREETIPSGLESRVKELERENARLREELTQARADAQAYWKTLQTVAPEYAITEAEMHQIVEKPLPFRDGLAEAERLLGASDGH